jgi:hypothetical protein
VKLLKKLDFASVAKHAKAIFEADYLVGSSLEDHEQHLRSETVPVGHNNCVKGSGV